jgi:hypothetical protein
VTAVGTLHPAFAELLERERDQLNARYRQRQQVGVRLDAEAFLTHVRDGIQPLFCAVDQVFPERSRSIVMPLVEISLDLFAAGLLGPEPSMPWVNRLWHEVLPQTARLLAREPQRVAGSLCNAVIQLAGQPHARPAEWMEGMAAVAPWVDATQLLLNAGAVLAWRAGMVQYRAPALAVARQLPLPIALRVLGLPASTAPAQLERVLERYGRNPWFRPAIPADQVDGEAIVQVALVGAFRGFGGLFVRPPRVRCSGHQWLVSDDHGEWQFLADAYGTLLQRVTETSAPMPPAPRGVAGGEIDRRGVVRWRGQQQAFPHLAEATSFACDGTTLAVTIPTSHHVFLLSRPGA